MKEFIAGGILLILCVLAGFNIWYLDRFTTDLIDTVEIGTEASAEAALVKWEANEFYTHVALRHTEVDLLTAELYMYLASFHDGQPINHPNKRLVIARLRELRSMERISLGTIF
ncbi:MAG: DUF4363 family protein [Oscillospiraceae bacterium]|jgi:hypothetical protein|nr:DUF4363 family protein [Oscillospiraceae bacterium]